MDCAAPPVTAAGPRSCQWRLRRRATPSRSTPWTKLECGAHLRLLQLGIAQGRANVAMAEHPLHDLDSLTLGDQLAGACVAQLVRRISGCPSGFDESSRPADFGPLVMHS